LRNIGGQWHDRCVVDGENICRKHGRKGGLKIIKRESTASIAASHDRLRYYDDLKRLGIITESAAEMAERQESTVKRKMQELYDRRLQDMTAVVKSERAVGPSRVAEYKPPSLRAKPGSSPATNNARNAAATIAVLATTACFEPEKLNDALASRIAPGVRVVYSDQERARLSECARSLFDAMLALARGPRTAKPASREWLLALAGDFRIGGVTIPPVSPIQSGPEPVCSVQSDVRGCPR
jgi:hypothetical protein